MHYGFLKINQYLKKHNVNYVDIRYELIDHFAEELKFIEGDFDEVFDGYFESKKAMIKHVIIETSRRNFWSDIKNVFKELLSVRFASAYALILFVIYELELIYGGSFLGNFDILPFVIPAPVSIYMFFKRNQLSHKSVSITGFVNWIFMIYMFFGIYWVRKAEGLIGLFVFSFFMTVAFYYYYLFFMLRKEDEKYLKLL